MELTELVEQICQEQNISTNRIEVFPSREGASFKLYTNQSTFLLKMANQQSRANTIQNESTVLQEIKDPSFVTSGTHSNYVWLLRTWLSGVTSSDYTAYVRQNPSTENQTRFVIDLTKMLDKVITLDKTGYLHGDLQPAHFLFLPNQEVHLLDLETSYKKGAIHDYKGALVHFVSPEVADAMLQKTNAPLNELTEVYAFGATAFFLYSDVVPIAYSEDHTNTNYKSIPFEEKLKQIVRGKRRSFQSVGVTPFPQLEQILNRCLILSKNERFANVSELMLELKRLVN
ncbi:serine/threonine-protein kinase [Risungbinella massiliensis]|uniref:hypothetical protein n=1 Tax=Risungbinella massiliensis TaxID=1329796 RepID=UPI0005CC1A73|nr:hypothetical protein [Risungbinella massiliensis]